MKKKILGTVVAFLMTFNLFACGTNIFAQETVGDYGKYAYDILRYLDKNLRERIAGTKQEVVTAEYIKDKLKSAGYEVTAQPFKYTKKGVEYNSQNIIVTKKGDSDNQVVVGAHYDSVGTAGVDDNGSGTVVNLETAIRMINVETPYTIKFVFFGAEETGLNGSKAYVESMTQKEKNNLVYMVNIDSILAGTYSYLYSGNFNEKTKKVENAWPVDQAMELAKSLNLDMHLNNTKLNYNYPSPTTGNWGDHASFRNFVPYLYFEAANWELLDDPKNPADGSSGAYETESGEVMHVPGRDDLTFIEKEWGDHGKNTIKKYCTLLPAVLLQLNPEGLKTNIADMTIGNIDNRVYTGREITPVVTVKDGSKLLEKDKDYTVSYSDNKSIGTAKVTIKGIGDYVGTTIKTFKISHKSSKSSKHHSSSDRSIINISDMTIENIKNEVYTGREITPVVTIKDGSKLLEKDKDYTVSYSDNKSIGTAKVTIKGIGDYVGTTIKTFKISHKSSVGWVNINGTWYYLKNNGEMSIGWEKVGNKWYYLSNSGAMQKGWINLNGTWYYLR
ncbi:M20/M25/M40 family metallo-hydrolase, partial [Romboutsia maritimum]